MPSPSMFSSRTDYTTRVNEIENYLSFVSELEASTVSLVFSADSSLGVNDARIWLRTLRASCFLLIYNLMESTMKNSVEAIFSDLALHSTIYDDCRIEIKKVVLSNFRIMSTDKAVNELAIIAKDVVVKSFDKTKVFSGNVDAQRIREISRRYGFSRPSADGSKLVDIKVHRNDLAHGNKSFGAIGRDYVASDITTIFQGVQTYLVSAMDNIEHYIENKHYLAAIAPTS
jgi:hypothetical protein